MKYLLQKSRLQHLIQQRNGYLVFGCGSLILNMLLVTFLFTMIGRERVVIVPPEIHKSFWVTSNNVSPEYLSEMVLFLSSLSLNLTPNNASMQHTVLLRYVDPVYLDTLKKQLIEVEDRLKKEHMTMTFFPGDVKVDTDKLAARVSGDLQYWIGDIQPPSQHVTYLYQFRYKQGRLTLASFREVKNA